MLQWQKIHAGDWHAKMLENSFIFVVPGAAFLDLSMPKSYEINKNRTKCIEKIYTPV